MAVIVLSDTKRKNLWIRRVREPDRALFGRLGERHSGLKLMGQAQRSRPVYWRRSSTHGSIFGVRIVVRILARVMLTRKACRA